MNKQLQGYINLTIIVLGSEYAEDLLPIRESDIQAIDEAVASLEKPEVINKLFGFNGTKVCNLARVKQLQHPSSKSGNALRKALRVLRSTKQDVFGKLSRSFLEEQLSKRNKKIQELRNLYEQTLSIFRQSAALIQLNNDSLYFGSKEQKEAYKLLKHSIFDVSIDMISFSVRTRRCLEEANVKTVRDLTRKTSDELLALPQFGRKSFNEVKDFMEESGLCLAKEPWAIASQKPDHSGLLTP